MVSIRARTGRASEHRVRIEAEFVGGRSIRWLPDTAILSPCVVFRCRDQENWIRARRCALGSGLFGEGRHGPRLVRSGSRTAGNVRIAGERTSIRARGCAPRFGGRACIAGWIDPGLFTRVEPVAWGLVDASAYGVMLIRRRRRSQFDGSASPNWSRSSRIWLGNRDAAGISALGGRTPEILSIRLGRIRA